LTLQNIQVGFYEHDFRGDPANCDQLLKSWTAQVDGAILEFTQPVISSQGLFAALCLSLCDATYFQVKYSSAQYHPADKLCLSTAATA